MVVNFIMLLNSIVMLFILVGWIGFFKLIRVIIVIIKDYIFYFKKKEFNLEGFYYVI